MKMKDAFCQWFYQARRESSSQAVVRQAESNPEYMKRSQQSTQLFENIKKRLGEDDEKWIFHFEEAENDKSSMREEWIYQQAFRDCFYLLQWMGAIRQV